MDSLTNDGCGPPALQGVVRRANTPLTEKTKNVTKPTRIDKRSDPKLDDIRQRITDTRFASWNVRTLFRPGAIEQIVRELKRYRISIAALQEVRWPGNGECQLENGVTLFYSGNTEYKHCNGTGFLVDKKCIGSVLRFDAISERLCVLRVKSRFSNISIINAYAPTEVADENAKDDFYEDLEVAFDLVPNYDVKILLGDFNAKIGKEDIFMPTIGKHSKHDISNDNGIRLISFASSKSLVVKSTMFPHKDIYKGTWKSPDGVTINQIDHVLIAGRHRNAIRDVRTFRGADCDSDHYMLGIAIQAKINSRQRHVPVREQIDVEKLKTLEFSEQFKLELTNRFENLEILENVDGMWGSIKNNISEIGFKVLGNKHKKKPRKWWNEECEKHFEERKHLRIVVEQNSERKEEYECLRNKTRTVIKRARKMHMDKIISQMENMSHASESRKFYQEVRSLRKAYQPMTQFLEDESGNLITDAQHIRRTWREYFADLLNCASPEGGSDQVAVVNTAEVEPPSLNEVTAGIARLKNNKASGTDDLPAELWKHSGKTAQKALHRLILMIWEKEYQPKEWNLGIICPIHKKGSRKKCGNYRGIALLTSAYKVLSYVLLKRLEPYAESIVGDYQCGFRNNRSTVDQIFLLKQLMEKKWEYAQNIHSLFVDFSKAYDSIDRGTLFNILRGFQIPAKLVRMIEVATHESRAKVRVGTDFSEEFEIVTGLKQGDALSPMLFNLALEHIMRKVLALNGGVELNGQHKVIGYADDIALLGVNKREVSEAIQCLEKEAITVGLRVNKDKTEYIHMRRARNPRQRREDLKVGDSTFKGVDRFKYLGCTITDTNTRSEEIEMRIQNTLRCSAALHKLLVSKLLSRKTKIRIYKTIIRPILMYGCEAWTLTQKEELKLLVTERKVLRKILGPVKRDNGTWRVRKNREVAELVDQPNIIGEFKAHRLRWLGHVLRMEEDRAVKRALLGVPVGRRPVGRPRYRWRDEVENDLRSLQVPDWIEAAQDRDRWRSIVSEAKTHFGVDAPGQ